MAHAAQIVPASGPRAREQAGSAVPLKAAPSALLQKSPGAAHNQTWDQEAATEDTKPMWGTFGMPTKRALENPRFAAGHYDAFRRLETKGWRIGTRRLPKTSRLPRGDVPLGNRRRGRVSEPSEAASARGDDSGLHLFQEGSSPF